MELGRRHHAVKRSATLLPQVRRAQWHWGWQALLHRCFLLKAMPCAAHDAAAGNCGRHALQTMVKRKACLPSQVDMMPGPAVPAAALGGAAPAPMEADALAEAEAGAEGGMPMAAEAEAEGPADVEELLPASPHAPKVCFPDRVEIPDIQPY